ncbi:MAG: N-acetylmuramoyl-L-alanine amidase [Saprospiraceae bacterium]|nr:N-acetylmuramoyl-L-alanine amidase [Saprospiraceae bacterium]
MFKQIIEAIKSLFKSLFGGSKKESGQPQPRPIPDDTGFPKDAMEVAKDTIVTVNEMDILLNPPAKADEDFDKDMFDEQPATPATPTAPTPQADVPTKPTETPTADTSKHKPRYLWCFDNGHGEATPGKRSPLFDDGKTRFFEYEFNRDIVKRIMTKLDKEGVKYYNVVPEVEGDISLKVRVTRANTKKSDLPKLYISVHSNASPVNGDSTKVWAVPGAKGIETWHHDSSAKSKKMAAVFQKHLIEKTGFVNRNLKTTKQTALYVLVYTSMPAILTENGFYNTKSEAAELMKDTVRQKIADAHIEAIMEIEKNGL